ncbi:MAG: OmpA family protein [Cyclobacteriaceae bacterium]|nr:OmpA family protein [Cyclobacteriaceae bacterium]
MLLPIAIINNRLTVLFLFLLSVLPVFNSFSQSNIPYDAKCYVIVGAFNLERNAALYKAYLEKKNINTTYRKNTYRNLYYVYSFESKDREETKSKLFKLRKDYSFIKDSWLYAGNFRGPHIPSDQWSTTVTKKTETISKVNTSINQPVEEVVNKVATTAPPREEVRTVEDVKVVEETKKQPEVVPSKVKNEVESVAAPPLEVGTYRIYINSFDANSLKEVSGRFSIIDAERNKTIQDINAHNAVVINKPNNATNRITIMSNIFDYRREDHTIDLDEPLTDAGDIVEVLGDTIMLNFNLLRFNKGDVITMWEVYFYKDAAIMKEESVAQLSQLLRMMQSNPNMKIKVHGHTNGNSHGKVLHLSEGDKNFFSLSGESHQEIQASAKKLSEFRAYTLEHWLINQGIDENRVSSVGWGGKKMIYDKHDSKAHRNVRVEIEILEE